MCAKVTMEKQYFQKKNNKKYNNRKQSTEIIFGKNACFGCFQGYCRNVKNREIYQIYILQNKFDDLYNKVPKTLRHLVQKCNAHELFSLTHEQDKSQGIALKVSSFKFIDLDELISEMEKKYNDNKQNNKTMAIFLLDRVQDPHNIGNIIRSSFCFNVHSIILTEHDTCGITSTVVRTSAGYSECSLICQVKNVIFAIEKLKKNNYKVIGFDVNTDVRDGLTEVVKKYSKCVFVFGSEGQGIKDLIKKHCDIIIKLPMNSDAESLNVANTAAIVGWEIMKRNNQ